MGGEWVITGEQEGLPKKGVKVVNSEFWSLLTETTFPAPAVILGKDKKQALITKHLGS